MKDMRDNLGMNIVAVTTLTFIALKLCNIIHWSWWWVFSPVLVCVAVTIALIILFVIYRMSL